MKLYKAEELAELYQIHPKTVYRLGREVGNEAGRQKRSVYRADRRMDGALWR